jgi:hypothetical protein
MLLVYLSKMGPPLLLEEQLLLTERWILAKAIQRNRNDQEFDERTSY